MSVDWTEQLESEIRTYIKNLERFETRLEEVNNDYNGCLQNLKERRASLARQFGVPEEIDVQFLRINPSLDEPVRRVVCFIENSGDIFNCILSEKKAMEE